MICNNDCKELLCQLIAVKYDRLINGSLKKAEIGANSNTVEYYNIPMSELQREINALHKSCGDKTTEHAVDESVTKYGYLKGKCRKC